MQLVDEPGHQQVVALEPHVWRGAEQQRVSGPQPLKVGVRAVTR
jgi:hypothetical protein